MFQAENRAASRYTCFRWLGLIVVPVPTLNTRTLRQCHFLRLFSSSGKVPSGERSVPRKANTAFWSAALRARKTDTAGFASLVASAPCNSIASRMVKARPSCKYGAVSVWLWNYKLRVIKRLRRCAAARMASASMVSDGDSPPPLLGKMLASTINRLRQR